MTDMTLAIMGVENTTSGATFADCGGLGMIARVELAVSDVSLSSDSLFPDLLGQGSNSTDTLVETGFFDCILGGGAGASALLGE